MKVSIITAARNARDTIGATIASVLRQSYSPIEYIVVDGLSTDGTLEVIAQHRQSLSALVVERDKGVYEAFNKGLRRATGDIIGFLNADDVFADDFVVQTIVDRFVHTGVDATFGDMIYLDAASRSKVTRKYNSASFRPQRIAYGFMPAHPTLYLKRAVYERFGEYDESYRIAGDFELVARIFGRQAIGYAHIPRVLVAMGSGGLSTRGITSKWVITKEMRRACAQNGIPTNYLKLLCRAPVKLLELLVRRETSSDSR